MVLADASCRSLHIAIDGARAQKNEATNRVPGRGLEQVAGPLDVDLRHRRLFVRRDRGRVKDRVDIMIAKYGFHDLLVPNIQLGPRHPGFHSLDPRESFFARPLERARDHI